MDKSRGRNFRKKGTTTNMSKGPLNAKCVLVGDMFVGKTSLAQVFVKGFFEENYSVSCGGTFMAKTLQEPPITLQVWDTAGMERFRSMLPHFMRDAACAMLIFDASERETFLSIRDFWVDFVKRTATKENMVMILIANKCDKERQVKEVDARALAEHYGMMYIETSAKTKQNVLTLFLNAAHLIMESGVLNPKPEAKDDDIVVSLVPDYKKKFKCCPLQ